MANKESNEQDDIWTLITKGLAEAAKMIFSVLTFIFTASSRQKSSNNSEPQHKDGWRDGHSGYGFYTGDMRNDDD
ncbi:hypothetical protein [Serratia aquatilis]|uniref:Uncharacterized protein n=1 Tax=Serratia aquatilis TaxID=1737515 RepID=A0ABV6EC55_9GAMM